MGSMTHPRVPYPSRTLRMTVLVGVVLIAAGFPAGLAAAEPPSPEAADQVVVRYRAGTTAAEREGVARAYGLTKVYGSANGRTEVVVARGRSSATARRQLAQSPEIVAVSANVWRDLDDEITDEEHFAWLWGLHNTGQSIDGTSGTADIDIDGPEALRIERGDPGVVVAVIDDGVDFTHPDLAERAWVNPGEAGDLSTNGIDDDGNGFIDDVDGWDFCDGDATVGPEGSDWHGTHVAGTIAASLDGQGVVGVAPGISVMSLRAFGGGVSCDDGDAGIIAAIDYAAGFGVPIINASWGGSRSLALEAAITDANETLLVVAAGNQGSNMDDGGARSYPAASPNANILSVAAIDQTGMLASFSNYGATSVDIAAPGDNIVSTVPGGYGLASGTSMAAPHVVGVAALALSVMDTTPTPIALRERILSTGAPLASTAGKTVTGRLVNAWRAIDVTGPVAAPIDRHSVNLGSVIGTTVSTTMTWPAPTDDLSGVRTSTIRRSLNGGDWSTLTSSVTTRSYQRTMAFGTPTRFELSARDGAGNVGAGAIGPTVTASLLQDGSSLVRYTGTWARVDLTAASGGRLHRSTRGRAAAEIRTTARAIAVVSRRGPLNGKARVYVDGVYRSTIDLRRSSWRSKVVVFNASWTSTASHSVKLVVVGRTGRVDVDAFVVLR
jgi:subtilisin family serine protease